MNFRVRAILMSFVGAVAMFAFDIGARPVQAAADRAEEARDLGRQAQELSKQGKYADAVPYGERAVAIVESVYGIDQPETALFLRDLADLYRNVGDYGKAIPLFRRALTIREKSSGREHPDTAACLNDLAVAYMDLGNYDQAEELLKRALAIREKALGVDHLDTAESVNNLAAIYSARKQFEESVRLFERALQIKEKKLAADDPRIATAHNNLAAAYLRMKGREKEALEHLQRSKEILARKLGPEHPLVAKQLDNLAELYWRTGDTVRVHELLQQALTIRENALGAEHFDTAQSMGLLAAFYQSTKAYEPALALYRRGLAAEDKTLANVFAVASEDQKLRLVQKSQGHYLAALSLIHQHFRQDDAAVRFGLELVLRRKGIVLDAQARTQETLAQHMSGAALQAWQRLKRHNSELSQLLLKSPGEQSSTDRAAIEALQVTIAREQEIVSEQSGLAAQELRQRQVTTQMIAGRLPPGSALVEFVRIRDWDDAQASWAPTYRYLAFVLKPEGQVSLVDLGEVAAIDGRISTALAAIRSPSFMRDVVAYVRETDADLSRLYDVLLRPLEPALGARRRLIVSPDGEINTVPFAALKTTSGEYLVETHMVSYVASGRDLARGESDVRPTISLLLVANPAFDDEAAVSGARGSERGGRISRVGVRFGPLPGTAEEARLIPPLIPGTKRVLMGRDATESAVRNARSPRVLHLATHGFFLKEATLGSAGGASQSRGDSGQGATASSMGGSGLALAGANVGGLRGGEDGILTALEVSSMDLYGTDLVVLSACETALGVVRTGEGVYGLRRAFVLAGAKNLIMSLWPVDDEVTRDLMERFYRAYGKGDPPSQSLHQALLQTIASLRASYEAVHQGRLAPVNLWAAFIMQQTGT
jgi:CHAT domain-containing protein/tetratricopeptide (TPR) repeat protein